MERLDTHGTLECTDEEGRFNKTHALSGVRIALEVSPGSRALMKIRERIGGIFVSARSDYVWWCSKTVLKRGPQWRNP